MSRASLARQGRTGIRVVCATVLLAAGCVEHLFPEPDPPAASSDRKEVHLGGVGSSRTDSGSGDGWLLTVGLRAPEDGWLFGGTSFLGEVSRLRQEDGTHTTRIVVGVDTREDRRPRGGEHAVGVGFGGGYALSIGDDGLWSVGLQFQAGIGPRWERAEVRLATAVYLWMGERDDEFDVDAEADVRLIAGIRF